MNETITLADERTAVAIRERQESLLTLSDEAAQLLETRWAADARLNEIDEAMRDLRRQIDHLVSVPVVDVFTGIYARSEPGGG